MARIVRVRLAEQITTGADGVAAMRDEVRTSFGPRPLPWTTELALMVILSGTPGEAVTIEVFVERERDGALIFSRGAPSEITTSGVTTTVIRLGPITFTEGGRYRFTVRHADNGKVKTISLVPA